MKDCCPPYNAVARTLADVAFDIQLNLQYAACTSHDPADRAEKARRAECDRRIVAVRVQAEHPRPVVFLCPGGPTVARWDEAAGAVAWEPAVLAGHVTASAASAKAGGVAS